MATNSSQARVNLPPPASSPHHTRSRKRHATSPLNEQSVGSARVNPSSSLTPNITTGTHSASVTGSAPSISEESLLNLRKKYHRTSSTLTQIQHHLAFIQECVTHDITPKGLQINIQPHAFLADKTDLKRQFSKIIQRAQASFLEILMVHYENLEETHKTELQKINQEISQVEPTIPDAMKKNHNELLQKTTSNIEKKKKLLSERATKKIEILRDPSKQTRRPRRNQSNSSRPNRPRSTSSNTQRNYRPQPQRPQNKPTYANITSGNFQQGGPGQVHPQPQLNRQIQIPLLPNPPGPTPLFPPPFPPYQPQPRPPTTQQQLIQTLSQLLLALATGN